MKEEITKVDGDIVTGNGDEIEEGSLIVPLKVPYKYEGKEYTKLDLTGLENIKAADMIAVSRQMNRNGNIDFLQEMTLEYSLQLVARSSVLPLPLEFWEQLPPYAAMMVKNRVTSFLYRQG